MNRELTLLPYAKMSKTFACFLLTICIPNPTIAQAQQSTAVAQVIENDIKIQRKRRGIDAELLDQGDYYMHPDGRQIRMLRKKDVYVIDSNDTARSMQRVKGQYGERVNDVVSHSLGGRKVVRVDNGDAVKRRRNETFDVSASMLKSSDNSIQNLKSVFANEQGDGDILLMPKLTVKLAADINPSVALNRLDRRYGLSLDRKLRVSGNVYSLSLKSEVSESQQFALVRRVMNDAMVEWAEPQFIAKAEKTVFEPDDTFFDEQWHLRNTGQKISRCDTDCDANNAWDIDLVNSLGSGGVNQVSGISNSPAVSGTNMVIAIIDDGVQLDHEDLNIWVNTAENATDGMDNDGNGMYIDDWRGWDFVIDSSTNNRLQNSNLDGSGTCISGVDSTPGEDNNPSPQNTSDCATIEGDDVENDDHGTAVAGLAAASGHNGLGVAGTAYSAEILPIRLISQFDTDPAESNSVSFCTRAAEAMEYAALYADVLSNSWAFDGPCTALDTAIANVTSGSVSLNGQTSKRSGGSPVLFASGNQASGWVKVSIPVSAGEHAYEWRLLRDDPFPGSNDGDRAWLDDITWPGEATVSVDFETNTLAGYGFDIGNVSAGNSCTMGCGGGFLSGNAAWSIASPPETIISGTQAAVINAASTDCGNTYLHILRDEPSAGNISFWVWVDSDTSADKFEFLIDGKERLSFGDFKSFVENGVIAYPANLSGSTNGVIAVGSSNSGDLLAVDTADPSKETRAFYSQYGPNLDVVAPSSNQQLGITTTDRYGSNADGYNTGSESLGDDRYTNTFGGTSASTPIVAGIAAAMLAINPSLSANAVRTRLRNTADQIGGVAYPGGRNDYYGHGRVNMYGALLNAAGISPTASTYCDSSAETFSFTSAHSIFQPQSGFFCPAIGELPEADDICFPIKAANGNVAVVCI